MSEFEYRSHIPAPAREVFDWHSRPAAFERLCPPWQKMDIVERMGGIDDGSRLLFLIRKWPFSVRWHAYHRDYLYGHTFTDDQVDGPFKQWVHTHNFLPDGKHASILEDQIYYRLMREKYTQQYLAHFVDKELQRLFRFRHERTRNDISLHQHFVERPRQRIAISGASGLVGSNLCSFLETGGHQAIPMVRRRRHRDPSTIYWNPNRGDIDAAAFENVGTVIHLAGENIASWRWTWLKKTRILNSRILGTRLLCETLASLQNPPRVLIAASAIGFYGDRGQEILTEESDSGNGFLASVCKQWEEATEPAREAGIRVVNLRIGIVLSSAGGVLSRTLPIFKIGMGGNLGTGRQYMSWIALDDLIRMIYFIMFRDDISGPVNATALYPITNRQFTQTLASLLKRLAYLDMPEPLIKKLLGTMGDELFLSSAFVEPRRMLNAGYPFLYPRLEQALRFELGLPEQ